MYNTTKDMTGLRFGKWTVISRGPKSTRKNSTPALWKCKCDCGTQATIPGTELRKKRSPTRSCGCSQKGPQSNLVGKYSRERHHAWKGGRHIDRKGYVLLTVSVVRDCYPDAVIPRLTNAKKPRQRPMYEHRAVMSNHLKRALYPYETVHHKNGDRMDNRLENLELRAGKHGPGQSISDLVTWAKEVLRLYASSSNVSS
jgi:hypothetical protein